MPQFPPYGGWRGDHGGDDKDFLLPEATMSVARQLLRSPHLLLLKTKMAISSYVVKIVLDKPRLLLSPSGNAFHGTGLWLRENLGRREETILAQPP